LHSEHHNSSASLKALTATERLGYIADMLAELERMAAEGGYGTLASILQVACVEALQTRDDRS
jgi:hypothetical protein